MELTLRLHGIKTKVLREEAEEGRTHIAKRLHRLYHSEQRRDHQKELLEVSGTRYVSPLR